MRFYWNTVTDVHGDTHFAKVRVLRPDDADRERGFGEMPDARLRLYLPRDTRLTTGSEILWLGGAYRCYAMTRYPTYIQADFRRRAR